MHASNDGSTTNEGQGVCPVESSDGKLRLEGLLMDHETADPGPKRSFLHEAPMPSDEAVASLREMLLAGSRNTMDLIWSDDPEDVASFGTANGALPRYVFPVDGPFVESTTMVEGKIWKEDGRGSQ